MRTRNIIDITNSPVIPSITRKAQVRHSNLDYEGNRPNMVVNVFSYLDGIEIKEMFKQVVLYVDNDMINPLTFENAEADEDGIYPEKSVGEYDHLYDLINTGEMTLFELEEMFIPIRIEYINEMMYGV